MRVPHQRGPGARRCPLQTDSGEEGAASVPTGSLWQLRGQEPGPLLRGDCGQREGALPVPGAAEAGGAPAGERRAKSRLAAWDDAGWERGQPGTGGGAGPSGCRSGVL